MELGGSGRGECLRMAHSEWAIPNGPIRMGLPAIRQFPS